MFLDNHRSKAVLLAMVAMAVACAGCGSTTDSTPATTSSSGASATSTPAAHVAGCIVRAPGPSSVDDVLAKTRSFAVEQICPAGVDATLATAAVTAQFLATTAGKVTADDGSVLSVFAGQLKSGSGDAFVHSFLSDLSARATPTKTLATDAKTVAGHDVTYFNVAASVSGYTYYDGPTVVIAHDSAGGTTTGAEAALATVLTNLHQP